MSTSAATPSYADLLQRLDHVSLRDRRSLEGRLRSTRKQGARAPRATLAQVATAIEAAEHRVAGRRAALPAVTYPEALPVSQARDDILAAIAAHQVVIVAGETGSGKTTQIPKMCLELGRGVRGLIGHTQPRRIAARTVAERIAEELDTPLGGAVGYTVRFTDRVGDNTAIRLMTDGILLAELQRDRTLSRYDTLIIDEAHERSLNIDFILGYLRQLLPRRPDLKVVITSATIDSQRFADHFGGAPVIEVSGRMFPVEVRYRPIVDPDDEHADLDRDQTQAICDAVLELQGEGPGDVLVFLSGEREIRDTADALSALELRGTEILPLYARLSAGDQHKVFQAHSGRRVVLATNVAETSLTVPGIRYVIDPGTARISRYSQRTKVQRLPIEAVSQASANQRKGRCGRVAEGICIRLYTEEDFLSRPEFTEPEILRTNLASVILQMTAIGLGDVAAFPFVEPPDQRSIKDGIALLHELGALDPTQPDPRKRLTALGRQLAQLPVDPRLARMVVEADRNGCVREVLVIAAALSIQDPRERPLDKQRAADQLHARFADKTSDFLSYLNLWNHVRRQQDDLSSSQFRRMCKAEFLHYLRIREWQDLHGQLRQVARNLGIDAGDARGEAAADPQRVHVSLLAGMLSHIGLKDPDKNDYLGARGVKFAVFPGSALYKKPPRWVMAAELVETSRLWGRIVARIEPEWAEDLAPHLVKRSYSEPHWEMKQGAVMAYEKVVLYGVPIVAARKVNYGRIDPEVSRELFIRHALVQGEWRTHHAFFHHNRALLVDAEELEHRARRRGIVIDDETLFDLYDTRVGRDVVSARHFDSWWKTARRSAPDLLTFTPDMMVAADADVADEDYPDTWAFDDLELALTYQFEPGTDADGVTVHIPLPVLNRITAEGFDWQIPGLREDLVTALVKSLPKALRRSFVPVPDTARAVLARLEPYSAPLLEALTRELRDRTGVTVPRDAWDLERVPDHLRITFRVEDEDGVPVGEGKDLAALASRLAPRLRAVIAESAGSIERAGLRAWPGGDIPRAVERAGAGPGGHVVRGCPALVDEGDSVAVRILGSEAEQRAAMWAGTRRLLLLSMPAPMKGVQGRLTNATRLGLRQNPHGSLPALLEDCVTCALDSLIAAQGGPAWDEASFATLLAGVRSQVGPATYEVVTTVGRVLAAAHDADRAVRSTTSLPLLPALTDVRSQLAGLVVPGFVAATGRARLPDLVRYLQAVARRLERMPNDVNGDRVRMARVQAVEQAYERLLAELPPGAAGRPDVREVRWMIEELRVSLFAQTLGTPTPVSEQRIQRAMDAVRSQGS